MALIPTTQEHDMSNNQAAAAAAAAAANAAAASAVTEFTILPFQVNITDIRTIVVLLESPENDVLPAVLNWIVKYAEQETKNRNQLINLKVIPALDRLCLSQNLIIRKGSIAAISAIMDLRIIPKELGDPNFTRLMVSLLKPDQPVEVQDEAATVISYLAYNVGRRQEIYREDGLKALIQLLASPDPDVKKSTTQSLDTLLQDECARVDFRKAGGIPPLINLMISDYVEIMENSLRCLVCLAQENVNVAEMKKTMKIDRVLTLFSHKSPSIVVLGLELLFHILKDFYYSEVVCEANGAPLVVQLLSSPEVKVRTAAFRAVFQMAQSDKNQTPLREAGIIPVVITSITAAASPVPGTPPVDNELTSSVLLAISALAKNDTNRNYMTKAGLLDLLIKIINLNVPALRKPTFLAMGVAAIQNVALASRLISLDGVNIILVAIRSALAPPEDKASVIAGVECLKSLSNHVTIRPEITRCGGIKILCSLLEHPDPQVQSPVTLLLAVCLQEEENRVVFHESKGVPLLCQLLNSPYDDVSRGAALALASAVSSETVAMDFLHCGSLETLIKLIRDRAKGVGKVASDARDRLLRYNLSAKYWLKSHVSSGDQIKDGFYDIGPTKTGQTDVFPTLSSLDAEPINNKREIIQVDAHKDDALAAIVQRAKAALNQKAPGNNPDTQSSLLKLRCLADIVAEHMGGRMSHEDAAVGVATPATANRHPKLHIAQIKLAQNSNVVPLGKVRHGIYYHRALLFKYLSDQLAMGKWSTAEAPLGLAHGVSLVRGEYGRAWNCVKTVDEDKLEEFVIDLMSEPGRLIPADSPEAYAYQHI